MTTSMSSIHSDNGDDKRIAGQIDGQPTPEPEVQPAQKFEGPEFLAQPEPARPRPNKNFVRSHPAHFIAFGGGAGLSPVAPGTAGTLVAFPLFWMFVLFLNPVEFLLLIVALFIIGIWACSVTGKALGDHDHGGMVWDEITAFLLILLFTPYDLRWQACAFLLFRLFDIIKPPPIRYYDRTLRGGFGVMFDDLLAAFLTLLCLAAWKAFVI
ncbi:phosphatidylglycerophosphatase [Nitrosospira sp. Nsp11]|uniref:phosphatidylglycerophosphatase A family protein n=1 Tax=Nitrosospira sp. Nsp11 TaxID=1855338 RepID=UPI0009243331|nr:phosphatidylglycerophosphatase [Nitrosospira sp. Nsp11]